MVFFYSTIPPPIVTPTLIVNRGLFQGLLRFFFSTKEAFSFPQMSEAAATTTRETRSETLEDGSIVTFVTYTNTESDLVNVKATNYVRPVTPQWTDVDVEDWGERNNLEMHWEDL